MLRRLERDAAIICGLATVVSLAIWPLRPGVAGGVVAGGLLIAIAYQAVKGLVAGMGAPGGARGRVLVKFFTRHAILALAAYVMMARLRLDAIGMLVGASSLLLAAGLEAARSLRPGAADSGHDTTST